MGMLIKFEAALVALMFWIWLRSSDENEMSAMRVAAVLSQRMVSVELSGCQAADGEEEEEEEEEEECDGAEKLSWM